MGELTAQRDVMRAQWMREKEMITVIHDRQRQLEELRQEEEQAGRSGNLGRAAEILFGAVPALER